MQLVMLCFSSHKVVHGIKGELAFRALLTYTYTVGQLIETAPFIEWLYL